MVCDNSLLGKILTFILRVTGKEKMLLHELTNYYLFFEENSVYYPINEIFINGETNEIIFKSNREE